MAPVREHRDGGTQQRLRNLHWCHSGSTPKIFTIAKWCVGMFLVSWLFSVLEQ